MILQRIKEYIDLKGISISAFEKSIGMSNASFGRSLKNNGAIGTDKLEKYPKHLSRPKPRLAAHRTRQDDTLPPENTPFISDHRKERYSSYFLRTTTGSICRKKRGNPARYRVLLLTPIQGSRLSDSRKRQQHGSAL